MSQRTLLDIPYSRPPRTPLSIITVWFSPEIQHNLYQSECVRNSTNQLIVVDNRANLCFKNLGKAILHGISQARHELLVIVHEDVFLPDNWQSRLEESLGDLSRNDPEWGVAGSVGWTEANEIQGHYSDPFNYRNTLVQRPFAEVERIDEQLLILRKSSSVRPDANLPSIHNIGRDIPLAAASQGMRTYVVNAPTVHKLADGKGRRISDPSHSPKISGRRSLTFKAEKLVSDTYFNTKWKRAGPPAPPALPRLDPIIMVSRGGSGSRLLSAMLRDLGIFLGNRLNDSGDSVDLAIGIYSLLIAKYTCDCSRTREAIRERFISDVFNFLPQHLQKSEGWGFKLPESILVLPELLEIFPNARFVHLVRDPLRTCLRRTHMTARLDNEIGRITIAQAYKAYGITPAQALYDEPAIRMALTTRHQLSEALDFFSTLDSSRTHTVWFEDIVESPDEETDRLSELLSFRPRQRNLSTIIDADRATAQKYTEREDIAERVRKILSPIRSRLGHKGSVRQSPNSGT